MAQHKDYEHFMRGRCAAFAKVLSKHYGMTTHATFAYSQKNGKKREEYLHHAFARNSEGKAVDYRGVHKTGIAKLHDLEKTKGYSLKTKPVDMEDLKRYSSRSSEMRALKIIKANPAKYIK